MKLIDTRFGMNSLVKIVVSGFYTKDNSPRIDLVDSVTGEPHATCTLCHDEAPREGYVFIKDYSENEGIPSLLAKNGVIERLPCGVLNGIREWKLTEAMVKIVDEARYQEKSHAN